jgi:NAD(P)-dependent dehydrogenase (short-subunit alcohol dehydrogenase family)
MNLEGNTILITAGSSGIGLELARALRRTGLRAPPAQQVSRAAVRRHETADAPYLRSSKSRLTAPKLTASRCPGAFADHA